MSTSAQGGSAVNRGLFLLSIDGGGIRGLSALFILKELLHRLQALNNLERTPLPCELFDLAGGTNTGGLITIMLFRLKMSVDDAITAYADVASTVFAKKKLPWKIGTFKASLLESSFVEIIAANQGKGRSVEAIREIRMLDKDGPKCFVSAISAQNMAFPTCFRSWIPKKNPSYDCSIVEAARATSASPTIFKSILIGQKNIKLRYIDASLRLNNPVRTVIEEATSEFPSREISCLLSLGTGTQNPVGLDEPDAFQKMLPSKLVEVLGRLVTDCEKTADEVEKEYYGTGTYFRLNVDSGLEDVTLAEWTNLGLLKVHTETYLQKAEVQSKLIPLLNILSKRLTEK